MFDGPEGETPLVDAMFSRKEPKSGVDGTLSWTVDILNPATGDDFAMFVKECVLPDGVEAAVLAYGCQGPIRSSSTG